MSSGKRKPGKGRGQDKEGRSKSDAQHVRLYHFFLKSQAWQSLKPTERSLYIAIAMRFNGFNNGEISMSVREAARELHIHRDTATKAFKILLDRGFIKCTLKGHFDYKIRHASTWVLTEESYQDQKPTKEYLRWKPDKINPGPKLDPHGPKTEPVPTNKLLLTGKTGSILGPPEQ